MDRSAQHTEEKPRQKHDLMLTFLGSPSPPSSDMMSLLFKLSRASYFGWGATTRPLLLLRLLLTRLLLARCELRRIR
jgi:hypothetical protein